MIRYVVAAIAIPIKNDLISREITKLPGYPDRARMEVEKALDTARSAHFRQRGGIRLWLGFFFGMVRDLPRILEQAETMKVMALKGPVWSGLADYYAGMARMLEGNWSEAATYLHKAVSFQESVGLFGVLRFLKFDQVEIARQSRID